MLARIAVAAALVLAVSCAAPAPGSAVEPMAPMPGSGIHSALRASWAALLDSSTTISKFADDIAGAAGSKSAALSKLVDDAVDLRKYLDDAAARVAPAAAGKGGRDAFEVVIKAIDPAVGARVPAAIDDMVNALIIIARQIEVAKHLNGGTVPAGFHSPAGAEDLLKAVARRTAAQKEAGGGRMFRLHDGSYMSLAENTEAAALLARLEDSSATLSSTDLRKVIAATETRAADRTVFEKLLFERYRKHRAAAGGSDGAVALNPAKAADDGAAVPKTKGTRTDDLDVRDHATRAVKRTAAELVQSVKKADFDARLKGALLIDEPGYYGSYVATQTKAGHEGKTWDVVAGRVRVAISLANNQNGFTKTYSRHKLSRFTDDVYDALRTKANDLEELRKLNNGKLPAGVHGMSSGETRTLQALDEFFARKPMQDFDGTFYSPWQHKAYEEAMEAARTGDWSIVKSDLMTSRFIAQLLQHYDTEMERSLRRALKSHNAKIPEFGYLAPSMTQGRVTLQQVTWDKVRQTLDRPPTHRNLMDKSKWQDWEFIPSMFGEVPTNVAKKIEAMVDGINAGTLALDLKTVTRLRYALFQGSSRGNNGLGFAINTKTYPDIALTQALEANEKMLHKVMDPKWDGPVYARMNRGVESTALGGARRDYPTEFVE